MTVLADALHSLVVDLTGKTAIWERQDAPRPKKPYLTMRLFSLRESGMDEIRKTATAGEVEIIGPREITCSIQWFGPGALNGLAKLSQSFQRPTIVDRCASLGFAVFSVESVQDVGITLDSRWEERAALDVHVRYMQSVTDTPGYIHDVAIDGTYLRTGPTPNSIPSTIEQVKLTSTFE